jgi:hypothetical protein
MTRSLRQRIDRLEGDQGRPGIPNIIVATCPIPGDGQPPTMETVERWLADGLAHIAFRGHAVLYNGGRTDPPHDRGMAGAALPRPSISQGTLF